MEDIFNREDSLVRYLLGQLNEEEQTRIEEKYFDDQEWFEQLQVVESELIDSYVGNQLSEKDREAFESCFLQVTERRQRIEFAKAWKAFVEKKSEDKFRNEPSSFIPSFLRFIRDKPLGLIPAAVAVLLLLGCVWLVFENVRLRNRLEQLQANSLEVERREQEQNAQLQREREKNALLSQQVAANENLINKQDATIGTNFTPKMIGTVSFALNSDTERSSGGIQRIRIGRNQNTLELVMRVNNGGYKKFSAEIKRLESKEVLQTAELQPQRQGSMTQLIWSMPTASLKESDYILTLKAADESGAVVDLDRYAFRVVKK